MSRGRKSTATGEHSQAVVGDWREPMAFRTAIAQTNYDSVFEPAAGGHPAKLTIRLKVALNPLDPAALWVARPQNGQQPPTYIAANLAGVRKGVVIDYNGSPCSSSSWIGNEWNAFKIRFKQMVEVGWNNQILLLPTDDDQDHRLTDDEFRQLVFNPRYPAYVACAIDIQLVPVGGVAHALIEVAHIDHSTPQNGKFRVWIIGSLTRATTSRLFTSTMARHDVPPDHLRSRSRTLAAHSRLDPFRAHRRCLCGDTTARGGGACAIWPYRDPALRHDGRRLGRHGPRSHPGLTRMVRHAHMSLGWTFMHRANFDAAMPESPPGNAPCFRSRRIQLLSRFEISAIVFLAATVGRRAPHGCRFHLSFSRPSF